MSKTIRDAIREGYQYAVTAPERLSQHVVLLLLADVLGVEKTWLIAHDDEPVSKGAYARYIQQIERVQSGEPLPYVRGQTEFFGLSFDITSDVLVPRPETELLVELILAWAQSQAGSLSIIDVGTGSGILAVSLAVHLPNAEITGIDISKSALKVAAKNAAKNGVTERIHFICSDLLKNAAGPYEIVVANLPYIDSGQLTGLDVLDWEPALALDGGCAGIEIIHRLLARAPRYLAGTSLIALEIGYDQAEVVTALSRKYFPQAAVSIHQDLGGYDRVALIDNP